MDLTAGQRHGSEKGKVVLVHRARQHDTGIVDEELLSVRTSAGTEMSFKSREIELNGRRPRISHGTNVQPAATNPFVIMKTPAVQIKRKA